MKNFILLAISFFLFQTQLIGQNKKLVKISGTIENPVSETVRVQGNNTNVETEVEDGKFFIFFELDSPSYLSFGHGQEVGQLYLEPGDFVELFLNPKEFDETLKLSGEGSEESNYLLSKYLNDEKHDLDFNTLFSKPLNEFLKHTEESYKRNSTFLENYVKANKNINKDFVANEKENLNLETVNNKLNYPSFFKYITKTEVENLPKDYFSFMDKINLNDEEKFKNNQSYNRIVSSYFSTLAQNAGEGIAFLESIFENVDSKISSKKIKEFLLFSYLNEYLNFNDVEGTEGFVEKYNNTSTNEENKMKIAKSFKTAISLKKGNPAPTFTYQNTKGEAVALSSFKGKIVYVDVWATWCGPCIREIPSLKELEKSYHGNNDIVFMSVSIDKERDKEKWLKMVDEKKLGGVQIMADLAWKSSIVKDYSIQGIPRFILIGKDGEIINKNAPRPSSEEIKKLLAELTEPR